MPYRRLALGCFACATLLGCDPMMGLDAQTQSLLTMAEKLQHPQPEGPPARLGLLAVREGSAPTTRIALDHCASGEMSGFYGVDLASLTAKAALRVTKDPILGTRARLLRLGESGFESYVLDAEHCSVLELGAEKTGVRINGISVLSGTAEVECTIDGTNIVAKASFDSCQSDDIAKGLSDTLAEGAELASAVTIPASATFPPIDPALHALTLTLHVELVGATIDGSDVDAAKQCIEGESAFLSSLGFQVTGTADADLVATFGCTAHVMQRENAAWFIMHLPKTDAPSLMLKAGDRVIAEVPRAARSFRCDLPESESRAAACAKRLQAWGNARVAQALARSESLKAFAAAKKPAEPAAPTAKPAPVK